MNICSILPPIFTGRYRHMACESCNARVRIKKTVNIYFHNLSGKYHSRYSCM